MMRVSQRERQVQHVPLAGQILAEDLRQDAPHRCTFALGDDTDRGTATRSEYTAELLQTTGRIGKEHETELTDHSVEGAGGEWQRLTVRGGRLESSIIKPCASSLEHRDRNIGTDHKSGRADSRECDHARLARPCCNIKDPVRGGDGGHIEYGGDE